MGKLLTKLSGGNRNNSNKNNNNNNNSNSNNNNAKNGAESKEEEKKQQTLAQKADSMQEVIPNIFMGSYAAAKDKELLEYHKITHILAIGWDLKAYFKEDFDYLILSNVEDNPSYTIIKHFDTAFQFMDSCLRPQNSENSENASNNLETKLKNALNDANSVDKNTQYINNSKNGNENSAQGGTQGRLFVHCHKGLSRSASIIMGYVMSREKKTFEQVLNQIRERRSFIMPNIGFQAQLQVFEEKKCSLDMSEYDHLDVMARISDIIPGMYNSIVRYYGYYENNQEDKVDGQDLFGLTMYFHQLFMLDKERTLTGKDKEYLTNAIDKLYNIQKKFIQIDESTTRFEKLFKLGKYSKPKAKAKPKDKGKEKAMVKPVKAKKKEEFEPPTHAKSERSMSGAEIAMDTAVLAAEHSAAEEDSEEDNLGVVGVDDNETNDNTAANASAKNEEENDTNSGNNGAETFSKNPTVQDMALLANNANNENETNENNENEKGNDGNSNENGNENNEDYAD